MESLAVDASTHSAGLSHDDTIVVVRHRRASRRHQRPRASTRGGAALSLSRLRPSQRAVVHASHRVRVSASSRGAHRTSGRSEEQQAVVSTVRRFASRRPDAAGDSVHALLRVRTVRLHVREHRDGASIARCHAVQHAGIGAATHRRRVSLRDAYLGTLPFRNRRSLCGSRVPHDRRRRARSVCARHGMHQKPSLPSPSDSSICGTSASSSSTSSTSRSRRQLHASTPSKRVPLLPTTIVRGSAVGGQIMGVDRVRDGARARMWMLLHRTGCDASSSRRQGRGHGRRGGVDERSGRWWARTTHHTRYGSGRCQPETHQTAFQRSHDATPRRGTSGDRSTPRK